MASVLALDPAAVSPQLGAVASAIPPIDAYAAACLAVNATAASSGGISVQYSFTQVDPAFAQTLATAQTRAAEWPGLRFQLIASTYGMIVSANAVGSTQIFNRLTALSHEIHMQGTPATAAQRAGILVAFDELVELAAILTAQITGANETLAGYAKGLQIDHDQFAGGGEDITAFEGRVQAAISAQMEQSLGNPFGSGVVVSLEQIAAVWHTALERMRATLSSVTAASAGALAAVSGLRTCWTAYQHTSVATAARLQTADQAAVGDILEELDIDSALREWASLAAIAAAYSAQLMPATAAGG